MALTDKMTPDEFAIYSAINHADDEWTTEATEALNRIKERIWDEGYAAKTIPTMATSPLRRPRNPYRDNA